jgi:hypothetical protein
MGRQIISYWVNLHDLSWGRVYLNDIPLYRSPTMGPHSRSGPANYLLVPGENEIKVELLKVKERPGGVKVESAFIFELFVTHNMNAPEGEKLDRELLLDLRFPKLVDEAPEEQRHYPFYYQTKVNLDYDLATPVFVGAPPAEFDCQGTEELRDAVRRIYGMLEKRDYEGLLDELALKFRNDEKSCDGEDAQRAGVKMQQWRDELFKYEPVPAQPLDLSMVHFEPRRDGGVAVATRHDDGYLLDVVCEKDPRRRIKTDLLFTNHQGRWRVFA